MNKTRCSYSLCNNHMGLTLPCVLILLTGSTGYLSATQVIDEQVSCAMCGAESNQPFVLSTSTWGGPDLDLRPAPMQGCIIDAYIHHCPSCGYCSWSLDDQVCDSVRLINKVIASESYQSQLSDTTLPEPAGYYLCLAMIEEGCEDYAAAGWSALSAAWLCDDVENNDVAVRCRKRAVELWEKALKKGQKAVEEKGTGEIVMADVLRRVGEFDKAIEIANRGLREFPAVHIRKILRFEKKLVRNHDTGRYNVDDVSGVGAPSRRWWEPQADTLPVLTFEELRWEVKAAGAGVIAVIMAAVVLLILILVKKRRKVKSKNLRQ